ncbi:hypothetical protein DVH24_004387 [Malus domestica]|uniref:Tropinone reductase I n=1 Tax=Malus domestica TaxID=3750 RepID=A0A498IGV1_MALDO|nr:hypothetical protein DVH24_004387 [Malus domestica]
MVTKGYDCPYHQWNQRHRSDLETVHTCARSKTLILERLQQWENKGFKVTGSVCDLTSKAQKENLIKTISSIFYGKLSILVGSFMTNTTLIRSLLINMKMSFDFATYGAICRGTTDYTLEDFSTMMETNVESPYHLSQLAHHLLKASGNVSIVFVASIVGAVALPKLSTYAATKSVVIQIWKNLACEWAEDNICTNVVAPWAVNTGVKVEADCHSDDFRRLIG